MTEQEKIEKSVTDEMIMAYVDGELAFEEQEMVRAALTADPELCRREALFRETATALDGAFDAPIHEEVPERLLNVVYPPESKSLLSWFQQCIAGGSSLLQPVPAGAFALIILTGIVLLLNRPILSPQPGVQTLLSGRAFDHILETVSSGSSAAVTLGDDVVRITPVLTFQDGERRFCRQFELAGVDVDSLNGQGLACRSMQGGWELVLVEEQSAQQDASSQQQGYELAGGEDAVDRKVEALRSGHPLTPAQERLCIGQGWDCGT